jgi:AraC-like DNA-binding protein
MPGSGSSIFTDADGYQASLRDIFDLLVLHPREFHARLTWIELPSLNLLRAQESSPRLAYATLPADRVFVMFPLQACSSLICSGSTLEFGNISLHAPGEHLHQRTISATSWGSISLSVASLLAFGRAISGQDPPVPRQGQLLRPRLADYRRLLHLHAQAGRIAETHLDRLTNREVARALEQDLAWILVTCLTEGVAPKKGQSIVFEESSTLIKLEQLLGQHPFELLRTRDICSSLGVSEGAVRVACAKVLGMSPSRYQRLRRLKLVRMELREAKSASDNISDLLARYGFPSLHRFVAEYWDVYGEIPPLPPRMRPSPLVA